MDETRSVNQVQVGWQLDLEGDKYADPEGVSAFFWAEYAEVTYVEWETPGCILIAGDGWAFGAPPEHQVKVHAE